MLNDSVDSRVFYQSQRGRRIQELLRTHIGKMWADISNERILPLGCASLLFNSPPLVSGRMTATQEENFSCLVDSKNKPLPDADLDCIVALHAAATSSEMTFLLREAWRVLKGEGRLLIIVSRRHSAWAQNPDTPFGCEEAYAATQIKNALSNQGFFVTRARRALYASPHCLETSFSLARNIEMIAPFLLCGGGVLLVEGQKRILGIAGAKKLKRAPASDPLFPLPLPI
jgi:SAM-dependent methyltransferase